MCYAEPLSSNERRVNGGFAGRFRPRGSACADPWRGAARHRHPRGLFRRPRRTIVCATRAPRRATPSAGRTRRRLARRARPGAALAHACAKSRCKTLDGEHQGPGGRRLADRGAGAQPRPCRACRRCAGDGGPRRAATGTACSRLPDEDGMETRVSPITGLNGRDGNGSLIQPLYSWCCSSGRTARPLPTISTANRSSSARSMRERRQQRSTPARAFEALEKEARAAGRRAFGAAADRCLGGARRLAGDGERMDAKAGADGPSTTAVRDLLSGIIDIAKRYAPAEAVGSRAAGESLSARR